MTRSLKLQLRLKQHLYQIHKNHSLQFLNRQNIEEQVFERRQCVYHQIRLSIRGYAFFQVSYGQNFVSYCYVQLL